MNKMPKKILTIISIIAVFFVAGIAAVLYTQIIRDAWRFHNVIPTNTTSTLKLESNGSDLYKPALAYEEAVTGAVDTAAKSVVSISASKDVPLLEACEGNPLNNLPPELQEFFGDNVNLSPKCESTKTQKKETGGGSGFVISDDGLILTNKHVVSDADAEYTVFTNDGKKYPAKVVAKDPNNDIAVLKVEATLPAAKLGDSDNLRLGQTTIAIGNALGEFRNTVSVGVLSGLSRTVTASGAGIGVEKIDGVLQTDAAINLGNSGGPLLNLRGEVIGINTAIASGAQNIGFAIPINHAKRAIESVKKTGSIKTPYIGVRYIVINEDIAKSQKLSLTEGALVRGDSNGAAVMKNSPAEKAGIKAEDIIISVNGEKIKDDITLSSLVQKNNIGDTVTLSIQRGDQTLSLKVVLAERPQE